MSINFFNSKKFDLQLGYEAVNENGFSSASSGTFKNDDQQAEDVRARLENYDFFASAEAAITDRFSIRPGFRYSFQSKFEDQNAVSLGFRYLFDKGIEARASIGKSYRTPNFDELYTYFVDSNHNLQGNKDLIPEQSMSYEISLKKASFFESGLKMVNNISTSYINIDDRISMVLAGTDPILRYQYLNIDSYQIWNLATAHQVAYKNIEAKLGASLVGVSQKIDTAALNAVSEDKFLYSFQLNSNIAYNVPKWNTLFSIYYKYTGPFQQYVQTSDAQGDALFVLSELEGYGMMDGSIRKSFFNNKFDVTLGSRNLLNVKTIQSTQAGGGTSVHDAASTSLLLGYGRSYFLKLTYNLNFN
ncbi:MAG: TonB-dependent receptor [Pedobacter sp.]|nr:MAG: TonB-dependent receptor [Pedobacter sp.]